MPDWHIDMSAPEFHCRNKYGNGGPCACLKQLCVELHTRREVGLLPRITRDWYVSSARAPQAPRGQPGLEKSIYTCPPRYLSPTHLGSSNMDAMEYQRGTYQAPSKHMLSVQRDCMHSSLRGADS